MTNPFLRPLHGPALAFATIAFLGCSGGKGAAVHPDAGVAGDGARATADTSAVSPTDGALNTPKDAAPTDAWAIGTSDAAVIADASSVRPPAYVQASNGRTSYDLLGKMWGEWVCGVLPQPDGQVILVGWANTAWVSNLDTWANNAFTLVRLNADGKPDPTFGTAGKTVVALTTHSLNACRAAVQTKDGKILAAGDAVAHSGGGKSPNEDFVVARFNQDGTLDTTFGASGFAITNFRPTPDDPGKKDTLASLTLLEDGRILVGGSMTFQDSPNFTYPALARYTPDGAPDPTFGTAGMVAFNPTSVPGAPADLLKNVSLTSTASAVVAEADGATQVGISHMGNITSYGFAILRLKPDGTPDVTFAEGGSRWEYTESPREMFEVAQLSRNADGRLVVLARNSYGSFRLYRYTAQGRPDPSFGTAGSILQVTKTYGVQRAWFMLRPADGGFLIGLGATNGDNNGAFGLLHLSADGAFDDAFGAPTWNWDTGPAGNPVPHITAGALFPNGDIMVAGDITTKNYWDTDTIALRLKKDGF